MPRNNNKPEPEVMTWRKAMPILIVCFLFDALRFFFNMFWFFGPALAGVLCTVVGSSYLPGDAGTYVAGGVCSVAAVAAGVVAVKATTAFGVVMAMAVGLIGWLTVLLMQILNNINIFKENFAMLLRFAVGLLIGVTPIISALPALTTVNIVMFHIQIKKGKEAHKKWEEETADARAREQQQRAQQAQQSQQMQQTQAEQIAEQEETQQEEQKSRAEALY